MTKVIGIRFRKAGKVYYFSPGENEIKTGDHVIVINAAKVVLTGKKLDQKVYYHHSGYVGGLKEVQYKTLMAENPEKAMMLAVKGMIPDNTIGRKALTRCRIYRDANHGHAAQKPEEI